MKVIHVCLQAQGAYAVEQSENSAERKKSSGLGKVFKQRN